jgi:hypothetical protein
MRVWTAVTDLGISPASRSSETNNKPARYRCYQIICFQEELYTTQLVTAHYFVQVYCYSKMQLKI